MCVYLFECYELIEDTERHPKLIFSTQGKPLENELRKSIKTDFVIYGNRFTKKNILIARILDTMFKTSFIAIKQKDHLNIIRILSLEKWRNIELEANLCTNVRYNLIIDINSCEPPPPEKY